MNATGEPEAVGACGLDQVYDEATLAAIEGWAPTVASDVDVAGWWRTSAAGAVLGAALLGLGEALEDRRPRDQPAATAPDPGQPRDPDALVELDFDPASPRTTTARIRDARPPR